MLSTYISIELFILSVLQKKMNNNFSAEKNIPFKVSGIIIHKITAEHVHTDTYIT